MTQTPLHFEYRNAKGETSQRTLLNWKEQGHYIKGYADDGRVLTFRKDRVVVYLDACDVLLTDSAGKLPPKLQLNAQDVKVKLPQIVFTGFDPIQREILEDKAKAGGMDVVKSVTKGLTFLCGGPNAGPMKLEKARMQHVYILDEPEFHALIETGELPDNLFETSE